MREYTNKDFTIADVFHKQVAKHPNKVCFVFEDKEWTFQQVLLYYYYHHNFYIKKIAFVYSLLHISYYTVVKVV